MGASHPILQGEGKWLYLDIVNAPGFLVIETRQTIYLTEYDKLTVLQMADMLIGYLIVTHCIACLQGLKIHQCDEQSRLA